MHTLSTYVIIASVAAKRRTRWRTWAGLVKGFLWSVRLGALGLQPVLCATDAVSIQIIESLSWVAPVAASIRQHLVQRGFKILLSAKPYHPIHHLLVLEK